MLMRAARCLKYKYFVCRGAIDPAEDRNQEGAGGREQRSAEGQGTGRARRGRRGNGAWQGEGAGGRRGATTEAA